MISATASTTFSTSKPCVSLEPCTRRRSHLLLQTQVQESIFEINNDGVSLLHAGNNKAAMIRLARCLAIMRSSAIEGDAEVHYKFTRPIRTALSHPSNQRYIFSAPLVLEAPHTHNCHHCATEHDEEPFICKLLSLILFNLSLAHHLYALELLEKMQYESHDEQQRRRHDVRDLLEKSLRLYELCHSSLVFTNSGLLCSDLSVAVVVTNNVGEVHKQLQQTEPNHQEHQKTAMACSEQLIQIFMFFVANGAPNRLEGFEDILSNAMASLNGPQIFAPAA